MKSFKTLCLTLPLILSAGYAMAQDGGISLDKEPQNTFYIGGGKSNSDGDFENDDTPYSIGFMHHAANKMIVGFDIGREGTMIDSTWGMDDEPKQATSFNLLLGRNLGESGRMKTDAAFLIGMRESFADCADSYIGYQCYADTAPDTEYKVNYGAVLTFTYDRTMFGVRVTGESTQAIVGFRF